MLTLFLLLKPAIFIWKQEVLEVKATEVKPGFRGIQVTNLDTGWVF